MDKVSACIERIRLTRKACGGIITNEQIELLLIAYDLDEDEKHKKEVFEFLEKDGIVLIPEEELHPQVRVSNTSSKPTVEPKESDGECCRKVDTEADDAELARLKNEQLRIKNEQLRIANEQHKFFSQKLVEVDTPERPAITREFLRIMYLLITKEKLMIKYLLGIPETLSEEDFENGSEIQLEAPHTFGETAAKFGVTVDRVCETALKAYRGIQAPTEDLHLSDEEIRQKREERDRHVLDIIILAKQLTPREERIMRFRFGIPENLSAKDIESSKDYELGIPHTREETAEELNVTIDRIRQIECKMLRGINIGRCKNERLRDYLD